MERESRIVRHMTVKRVLPKLREQQNFIRLPAGIYAIAPLVKIILDYKEEYILHVIKR